MAAGHGEGYMQEVAALSVSARMEYGGRGLADALGAAAAALERREAGFYGGSGAGGLIAVGHDGGVEFAFTSGGMYRGWRSSNGTAGVKIWDV